MPINCQVFSNVTNAPNLLNCKLFDLKRLPRTQKRQNKLALSMVLSRDISNNNKFKFYRLLLHSEASMHTQQYSDQETIERYSSPTLQNLLNENKMKDLALSKATNLIELLNIELQVERNTNQQNIRHLEIQLQRKYESQIQYLRQKVELLQQQLGKGFTASRSTQKGKASVNTSMRACSFSRASSVRSFDNQKRRSVNKKYTQNNTNQSASKNGGIPSLMICDKIFKADLLQLEDWKQKIIVQLDQIIQQQYKQLGNIINAIEACSQDFQEVAAYTKTKQSHNLVAQMACVIKEQQSLINSWRAYAQELQDLHKSYLFKTQSLSNLPIKVESKWQFCVEQAASSINEKISIAKREWRDHLGGLQQQNDQLKNILDGMIELVKQQKRIKR